MRPPDQAGAGEGLAQGAEREQHQVVPRAYVCPLVGQDRREFRRVEQGQGSRADDDPGADPGHAVRRRGRAVHHERPGHLGVAVGEQAEQDAVPPPGEQDGGGSRQQHPAEQDQQGGACHQEGEPGQCGQGGGGGPERGVTQRLGRPGQHAPHDPPARAHRHQPGQRPYRGQAPAEPERLPEQDRRRRGAGGPAGGRQRGRRGNGPNGDNGEEQDRLKHRRSVPGDFSE